MIDTLLAVKVKMDQTFMAAGQRVPYTAVKAGPCLVAQIKTTDKDGYQALQLGLSQKKEKSLSQPVLGHLKKATQKTRQYPRFLKEVGYDPELNLAVGDLISADQVFQPGDLVDVTGISIGKGFTGVVKRWGFAGGPKTHGQSDRQRSPGSIGQGTTPGRIYKGKKMAGRSGNAQVTVKNLLVLRVDPDGELWLKGQVPGCRKGLLVIRKVNQLKNFPGLYSDQSAVKKDQTVPSESPMAEPKSEEISENKIEPAEKSVTSEEK